VTEAAYYIVAETPEGVWGTDVEGLYLERLAPWQSDIRLAEVEGNTGSGLPSLFGLRQAAAGIIDNFVHTVVCGKCGREWQDGLRYQAVTVVRCPQCGIKNSVDSRRFTCVGLNT
jgi:DNA-directed RNA polymerase subunit RPC12/RpoP